MTRARGLSRPYRGCLRALRGKVPGGPFSLEVRARGYAPVAVKFDESTPREGAVITLAPGKEQQYLHGYAGEADSRGQGERGDGGDSLLEYKGTADAAGRAILTDLPMSHGSAWRLPQRATRERAIMRRSLLQRS